jgi:hypothetical protein
MVPALLVAGIAKLADGRPSVSVPVRELGQRSSRVCQRRSR